MTDPKKLPLLNTLVFRGEEVVHPAVGAMPVSIEVNVTSSWAKNQTGMRATIVREVGTILIEEGLRLLKQLHDQTIPMGPYPVISEESHD